MDNARVFMSLRPAAKFTDDTINFFDLETITKTYIGSDIPTQSEMDAEWALMQSDSVEIERIGNIKAEADRRILKLDPSWTLENHAQKQRNDLMAGLGILLSISKAINSGAQADTDEAIAAGDAAMAKAIKIETIRAMSNLAEANGHTVAKFQDDLIAAGF